MAHTKGTGDFGNKKGGYFPEIDIWEGKKHSCPEANDLVVRDRPLNKAAAGSRIIYFFWRVKAAPQCKAACNPSVQYHFAVEVASFPVRFKGGKMNKSDFYFEEGESTLDDMQGGDLQNRLAPNYEGP